MHYRDLKMSATYLVVTAFVLHVLAIIPDIEFVWHCDLG